MLNRNFTGQGKLLQAYLRMAKKLDMVMWDLYQQMCLVCCSVEYIKILKEQDNIITEFDEALWGSMVEFVTIGKECRSVTFKDGTEITVE